MGEKWLRYLCLEGIDFVIRLSEGCYRLAISAAPGPAYSKLTRQAYHRKRGVIKQFTLNGCTMSIVMLKNQKKMTQLSHSCTLFPASPIKSK
jgi:hypothetical protein